MSLDYRGMTEEAVRFIEAHLAETITIENIAAQVHVSPFHFHRVFTALTGETVAAFIRRRRLEEAARALEDGRRPITDIALGSGFSSQATFTRAFARTYGTAPGRFRRRTVQQGVVTMKRLEVHPRHTFRGLVVEGLDVQVDNARVIVPLWETFLAMTKDVRLQRTYGICLPGRQTMGFTYMAGTDAEVTGLPQTFAARSLEPQAYAVFGHDERQGTIREAFRYIWSDGLPASGRTHADGLPDLEVYEGATVYEPGPMELWIPVL